MELLSIMEGTASGSVSLCDSIDCHDGDDGPGGCFDSGDCNEPD